MTFFLDYFFNLTFNPEIIIASFYPVNIYLVQIKKKDYAKGSRAETDKQKLERINRNLGKP